MRLLHTSDWHIGRSLHGADLLADQERVLTGLAGLIRAESVDVVVVSGDIYDRAIPPAAATSVLDRVLTSLRATGAQLVLIPGNHDSAVRLAYAAGLLAANGVHFRTRPAQVAEPVLIPDEHGEVAIYGIPYLEPDLVKRGLGVPNARGHTDVLRAAMDQIRADQRHRGIDRTVVLAHAFVAGGVTCDSERDISVGGVEVVPADAFAGVSYVALGHLHRPQEISPAIHYSGSPLAYAFPEGDQLKSVKIVDLDGAGLAGVTEHALERPRRLVTLAGTLDQLLTNSRYAEHVHDYVSARLLDDSRPLDAMRRLRGRFIHCVHLEWAPSQVGAHEGRSYADRIRGRSDLAITIDFVHHVRTTAASQEETDLLCAALTAGRAERSAL